MPELLNAADYRAAARRRLPKGLFEYIDRGTEDETALRRLRNSLDAVTLHPRALAGGAPRTLRAAVMGQTQTAPLVIAPTALAGIVAHDGEIALARAAAGLGLPFCVSTQSVTTIESIRKGAPGADLWFQLYVWKDRARSTELLRRVHDQGCDCLVLTVDTPAVPNREYNRRNRFSVPFQPGLRNLADVVKHPRWALSVLARQVLRDGLPSYGHYPEGFRRNVLDTGEAGDLEIDNALSWADLEHFRDLWPGRLVIKGVLSVEDSKRALSCGVDGIVVSSHGARNFDALPSPASVLRPIADAVTGEATVMADSGVMRGSDVLKYLALGAQAVLLGRLPLWGLAVNGESGATSVLSMLMAEMETGMGFLGASVPGDLLNRATSE